MYKLIVSELAHKDLDSIILYITFELANPVAASHLLDETENCYENLKSNPLIYERCHDASLEKEAYRKALINNYVLVYKVNESAKIVTVYRFFYGAQNYLKLI